MCCNVAMELLNCFNVFTFSDTIHIQHNLNIKQHEIVHYAYIIQVFHLFEKILCIYFIKNVYLIQQTSLILRITDLLVALYYFKRKDRFYQKNTRDTAGDETKVSIELSFTDWKEL